MYLQIFCLEICVSIVHSQLQRDSPAMAECLLLQYSQCVFGVNWEVGAQIRLLLFLLSSSRYHNMCTCLMLLLFFFFKK